MREWSVLLLLLLALSACDFNAEGPGREPQAAQDSEAENGPHSAAEAAESPPVAVDPPGAGDHSAHDYFSFANSRQFTTRHLQLDLSVDFERQRLDGEVRLHMRSHDAAARQVVLDTRGLNIDGVSLAAPAEQAQELEFRLGDSDPVKGQPLYITLPQGFEPAADEFQLLIRYQTGPDASALMWLPPELTAGGEQPFMFTQSQSIHARSWVPLQDTPAVRVTYEATVHTPPEVLALMSADNDPQAARDGEYHFSMPQPIPSYLLALAVGDLEFHAFGDDTGVYAEPDILPAAAHEFADTQDMLDAASAIYGDYQWGRYDLLILPPSFPYGGMENPRLSFITPTVLAGDRSLVSLIAHELAHSWSGNLVSNASWRDIWLNEGTTSYLEARLMEVLYGAARADEERVLAYQSLLEKLQTVPEAMQPLAPEFRSGDPDVGQDGLEYSKGQLLLETLEHTFGRETFDAFLSAYFNHFAFQAISSETFLDYLDEHLLSAQPGKYSREQVEQWLYRPGVPASAYLPSSDNLDQAARLAGQWAIGETATSALPREQWSPQAVVYFLKALPAELTAEQLQALDAGLGLSASANAEISREWFIQVATRRFQPAYPAMRHHLGRYGRTRLVEPVFQALTRNGHDGARAREWFAQVRENYHPLTVAAVQRVLDPSEGGVQ